ncbi:MULTISPECIES: cupin domain-containing protein [unclassified Pseudoalteromonas]|uniref:cupin domain-containing protein n=1 Tax=unclassified Pseudoalteromonas TaxID=194690 RepID=UPI002097572C|nr:cupin domain-containing protein [Pseudoalteromonas sp. XMcav2-N]MCO7188427.1 cupin domain-containing protein [Pseudoalteromonas sp. XMcav2-N]
MHCTLFTLPAFLLLSFAGISAEQAHSAEQIKVETLTKQQQSWNGATLPAYPKGQPEVRIMRFTIPAGQTLPIHKHPYINAGLMIQGELMVETETGETLHIKAGDTIVEVLNTWHWGKNVGKEAAQIVVFYAGVKDQAVTLKPE